MVEGRADGDQVDHGETGPSPRAIAGRRAPSHLDHLQHLADQRLSNVTITSARVAPAADVPASCRVSATLTPTPDSDIKIELWMPMAGWNGKFHSAGGAEGANSAIGGSINYAPMRTALSAGYATAGTDGGHQGATLSFGPGHPEKGD